MRRIGFERPIPSAGVALVSPGRIVRHFEALQKYVWAPNHDGGPQCSAEPRVCPERRKSKSCAFAYGGVASMERSATGNVAESSESLQGNGVQITVATISESMALNARAPKYRTLFGSGAHCSESG